MPTEAPLPHQQNLWVMLHSERHSTLSSSLWSPSINVKLDWQLLRPHWRGQKMLSPHVNQQRRILRGRYQEAASSDTFKSTNDFPVPLRLCPTAIRHGSWKQSRRVKDISTSLSISHPILLSSLSFSVFIALTLSFINPLSYNVWPRPQAHYSNWIEGSMTKSNLAKRLHGKKTMAQTHTLRQQKIRALKEKADMSLRPFEEVTSNIIEMKEISNVWEWVPKPNIRDLIAVSISFLVTW